MANQINLTPPNLAQSMAEEIAKELIDGKNPAVDIGDYSNGSYDEELAAQIIQRRIEPMVKVAENARYLLEAFDGDNETVEYFARNALRQALSKL